METADNRRMTAPQEISNSQPLVTDANAQLRQLTEQMSLQGRILDKVLGLIDEIADKQTRAETRLAEVQKELQTKMMEEMRSMEEHMSDHMLSMVTMQQGSVDTLAEQLQILKTDMSQNLLEVENKLKVHGDLQTQLNQQFQESVETRLERIEEPLQQAFNSRTFKAISLPNIMCLASLLTLIIVIVISAYTGQIPSLLTLEGVTMPGGIEEKQLKRLETLLTQQQAQLHNMESQISGNVLELEKKLGEAPNLQLQGVEALTAQQKDLETRIRHMETSLQQTLGLWIFQVQQCPRSPGVDPGPYGPPGSKLSDEPWTWSGILWVVFSYLLMLWGTVCAVLVVWGIIERHLEKKREEEKKNKLIFPGFN